MSKGEQMQRADHRIDSSLNGLKTALRNKHVNPDGPPVLFVHGATYPSTIMFDYPVDGVSWMDWMAARGFDVWCIDLPGYGLSDRPLEMTVPADQNAPVVTTADAERDVARAVDFILARRSAAQLDLVGYSWGTAICGGIAARHPGKVRRLVLSGALWCRVSTQGIGALGQPGAWRQVEASAVVDRWCIGLDDAQKTAISTPAAMRAWADAAIATDPETGSGDAPFLRAPAGVVQDVQQHWLKNDPTWDPSRVTCPTQIVVGEWDHETTPEQGRDVFERLTAAAEKRYTLLGAATHSMLLENRRHALYDVVHDFLTADI
ncbi:MAG: alpha/beta hydrolase [Minwuia sp.]|nr:alpha/beta hydrolase [Minwuia sp.]